MDTPLVIVIVLTATFVGGVAFGFMMGVSKGMSLGARFRSGRPVSPIAWLMCFIGSGILLLVAIGTSIYSGYFLANSSQADGVVMEIIQHKDEDGDVSYYPAYSYSDASGKEFQGRSSMGSGPEYQVGDSIPIRYLKKFPHESRIDYFSHHWALPIIMSVLSIALIALGFCLRWWRRREQEWANKALHTNPNSAIAPSGSVS